MRVKITFADETNADALSKKVSHWLDKDYRAKEKPEQHFWHNKETISTEFQKNHGMILTNEDNDELMGYMIWWGNEESAALEINIVEVADEYRRQGCFTLMRNALLEKYPYVRVLLAKSIPSAMGVYNNPRNGWKLIKDNQFVLATEKACASPLTELPRTGSVIAVCPVDFFKVSGNKEGYRSQMKYYVCEFDGNHLKKPIFNQDFTGDHYLGLYKEGRLITEGKVKYLFEPQGVITDPCLILSKLVPERNPSVMFNKDSASKIDESGFFSTEVSTVEIEPASKRPRRAEDSVAVISSSSAGLFFRMSTKDDEERVVESSEPGAASGGGSATRYSSK